MNYFGWEPVPERPPVFWAVAQNGVDTLPGQAYARPVIGLELVPWRR